MPFTAIGGDHGLEQENKTMISVHPICRVVETIHSNQTNWKSGSAPVRSKVK
jgi:hypothetical protein